MEAPLIEGLDTEASLFARDFEEIAKRPSHN
jgi:hypothetical protein